LIIDQLELLITVRKPSNVYENMPASKDYYMI